MKFNKKYLFILGAISPIILLLIGGKNNIIFMVVSLCIYGALIPFIFISEGLNPNTSILLPNSRFKKRKKQRWMSISDYLFRISLIIVGLTCIWYFSLPIYLDTYLFAFKNETENGRYLVTYSNSPISLLGLVMQTVHFQHSGKENYNYYFSPNNRIRKNKTYDFIILPNSKIIVSAKQTE